MLNKREDDPCFSIEAMDCLKQAHPKPQSKHPDFWKITLKPKSGPNFPREKNTAKVLGTLRTMYGGERALHFGSYCFACLFVFYFC